MTTLFEETDSIITLGKWAYMQIPYGARCKSCPLLSEVTVSKHAWYCNLRRNIGLNHDSEGPFKDIICPGRKKETCSDG